MINDFTKKVKQTEKQIISNMTEQGTGEYEIKEAGYDLASLKADGFKYDPELDSSPLKQVENFCDAVICASYNY